MLGTVPQHKEWGDTNNSYGWNWKEAHDFQCAIPTWQIVNGLVFIEHSSTLTDHPKLFFIWSIGKRTLQPSDWQMIYSTSSATLQQVLQSLFVILLWNMCSSVPTKVQNPKISNHVKPSSCWSKSSLSADQTVSIYYLQVKMKLATVGNI